MPEITRRGLLAGPALQVDHADRPP